MTHEPSLRVLAAIDHSAASRPVLKMATAIAPLLGATVEAVHVSESGVADGGRTARAAAASFDVPYRVENGDALDVIVSLAAEEDVVAVAIGARGLPGGPRPAGHLALALANRIDKPVLVVPPDAKLTDHVHTVLVAMEGTPANARHLKRAVDVVAGAGLELIVVHVDDKDSIPSFSDQVQHETEAYTEEFLARYARGAPGARLELRVGRPVDEILATADALAPELLAMGWPQPAAAGRGRIVRDVLDRAHVPVLLVATD